MQTNLNDTIADMQKRINALEILLMDKPEKIKSPHLMGDLIKKYDITASQAADVLYGIKKGELKTDAEIEQYLKLQKINIEQAQNNQNQGGEKKD